MRNAPSTSATANQRTLDTEAELKQAREDLGMTQTQAARSQSQLSDAIRDLATRTLYIKILLIVAFGFAMAAIAGWLH